MLTVISANLFISISISCQTHSLKQYFQNLEPKLRNVAKMSNSNSWILFITSWIYMQQCSAGWTTPTSGLYASPVILQCGIRRLELPKPNVAWKLKLFLGSARFGSHLFVIFQKCRVTDSIPAQLQLFINFQISLESELTMIVNIHNR